jgi:hypothetical protein
MHRAGACSSATCAAPTPGPATSSRPAGASPHGLHRSVGLCLTVYRAVCTSCKGELYKMLAGIRKAQAQHALRRLRRKCDDYVCVDWHQPQHGLRLVHKNMALTVSVQRASLPDYLALTARQTSRSAGSSLGLWPLVNASVKLWILPGLCLL